MSSVLLAAALFLGAPAITGCGDDNDDDSQAQVVNTYCVLEDGTIVPMEYCDDDGDYTDPHTGIVYPYWIIMNNHHYNTGHRLTGTDWHRGRIRGNDPAARANAGLPRTGRPPATISDRGIGSGRTSTGRGTTGSSNHGGGGGSHSSSGHSGGG